MIDVDELLQLTLGEYCRIVVWYGNWTLVLVALWIERIWVGITGMEPEISWG